MRIALIHSFYSSNLPSGENAAVVEQLEILRQAGHEVSLFAAYTDKTSTQKLFQLKSATRALTGYGNNPLAEIAHFKPDVVHIHNLFPNFSTRWVLDIEQPVVHTMHNFRAVCSNGLLFRDGKVCTDCVSKGSLQAIKHSCYRGSKLATLPLALGVSRGIQSNPVFQRANALIALSAGAADKFGEFGADVAKIMIIPSSVPSNESNEKIVKRSGWVFVGRLSPEKGLGALLDWWPPTERLDVIGSGPALSSMRSKAPSSVSFLGLLPRSEVLNKMNHYRGLVFPSNCLETQGLVVAEAFSSATPVLIFNENLIAQSVRDAGAGAVYSNAETLRASIQLLSAANSEFGLRAKHAYETTFSPSTWLEKITDLYQSISS